MELVGNDLCVVIYVCVYWFNLFLDDFCLEVVDEFEFVVFKNFDVLFFGEEDKFVFILLFWLVGLGVGL